MAERLDKQADAARKRIRELATEALKSGRPVDWFDRLYREAAGDVSKVPWADRQPNAAFAAWASSPGALEGVRSAVVIGCGLGDDAEFLAARGIETVGFDVSPTAIEWAKRAHAETTSRVKVRYEVHDLFALPASWRGQFDLAVEVYTLQALPGAAHAAAAAAITSLLAPRGKLFLFTRLREEGPLDELVSGPPWPLSRSEAATLLAGLRVVQPFVETPDPADPSIVRAYGVWAAPPVCPIGTTHRA